MILAVRALNVGLPFVFDPYMFPCPVLYRVEKYRPQSLDELISHKDIVCTSQCCYNPVLHCV